MERAVNLPVFLGDTPCKRLLCLHKQVFAVLRSVLDACQWHTINKNCNSSVLLVTQRDVL